MLQAYGERSIASFNVQYGNTAGPTGQSRRGHTCRSQIGEPGPVSCRAAPLNRAWTERSRRPRHRAVSVSDSQGQSGQTQRRVSVIRLRIPPTYHGFGHPSQVLVEIISFYNRVGQVSWVRAEGIFDKFYELLRDARDPVKETVLITIGRVGRLGVCADNLYCAHRFSGLQQPTSLVSQLVA
jgi:hypothetical protein